MDHFAIINQTLTPAAEADRLAKLWGRMGEQKRSEME
jgi:hypothetical protein